MKCDHCGYEGRGRRGFYISRVKGEHWKCIVCNELTKIPIKKKLQSIKGFCKDCSYAQIDSMLPDGLFECMLNDTAVKYDDYCSKWEKSND